MVFILDQLCTKVKKEKCNQEYNDLYIIYTFYKSFFEIIKESILRLIFIILIFKSIIISNFKTLSKCSRKIIATSLISFLTLLFITKNTNALSKKNDSHKNNLPNQQKVSGYWINHLWSSLNIKGDYSNWDQIKESWKKNSDTMWSTFKTSFKTLIFENNKHEIQNSNNDTNNYYIESVNNYQSSTNLIYSNNNKYSMTIHGDFEVASAINLEQLLTNGNYEDKIIINKFNSSLIFNEYQNFTLACASHYFTIAVNSSRNVIFFGEAGVQFGETNIDTNKKILWNLKENQGKIEHISCGYEHAFILTEYNELYVFGSNRYGQIGMGNDILESTNFLIHNSLDKVKKISTFGYFSLFINLDDQVYFSGFFTNKAKIEFNIIPLIYKSNHLKAKSVSAYIYGGLILGNDSCIYNITLTDECYTTLKDCIDLNNSTICDQEYDEVYIDQYGNRIIVVKGNSLIEFNNQFKIIKTYNNILDQNIKKFSSNGNILIFSLSNNTVLASTTNKFYNLDIGNDFQLVKDPNKQSYLKYLDCSIEHCVLIDQNNSLATLGIINDKKTCNYKNFDLSYCNDALYINNFNYINSVIPYMQEKLNIAILGNSPKGNSLLNYNYMKLNFKTLDFNNSYPLKDNFARGPVFTYNSEIFTNIEIRYKLVLNLTNFLKNNSIKGTPDTLYNFTDFIHVSILNLNYEFKEYNYAIYHIARGPLYRYLFIAELNEQTYSQNDIIYSIDNVKDFWISSYPQYSPLKNNYIVGLKNDIIFILNLKNLPNTPNTIEYKPSKEFENITLTKISTNGKEIGVISSDGKAYIVDSLDDKTYKLIEIHITTNNPTFINIAFCVDDRYYLLTKDNKVYFHNNNDTIKLLDDIENINHIQPFAISYACGMQLIKDFTCKGLSPHDPQVCNGHGRCVYFNFCICYDNYFGDYCDELKNYTCKDFSPYFKNYTCDEGYICKEGKCICKEGYICEAYLILIIILIIIMIPIFINLIPIFISSLIIIILTILIKRYTRILNNIKNKKRIEYLLSQELDEYEDEGKWENIISKFKINNDEIKELKLIGFGKQGNVYLAEWRGGLKVAIKNILTNNTISLEQFKTETDLLITLRHPNIVTFYGATLEYPKIGIVLEYSINSVDKFIESGESKKLTKKQLIQMLLDVCYGMSYLHSKSIVHRDLKWHNVLLNELNKCKIADFGLSKFINLDYRNSDDHQVGTPIYNAPEKSDTTEVDIYSFGIMTFELLCGVINPWTLDEETKNLSPFYIQLKASLNPNFRPNIVHLIGSGLDQFIPICQQCWAHDPSDRPNFDELIVELTGLLYQTNDVPLITLE